ncbi:hypothetical protein B0H14DRAFT_2592433 [Mycena olivaceomarginata]|nr:hypothetical protein B0H14DRAFT_2592433 [Mycena olivaceomarginata]
MSCAPQDSLIQFIVVGGSVGGLCAAYTLRQSGHSVVVLDKRNEGVDTLPGVADLLKEHGSECNGMTVLKGETSKIIGRMQFSDEVMADLGCKFHMIPVAFFEPWEYASANPGSHAWRSLAVLTGEPRLVP